jgi:hypothetical protein
MAVSIPIISEFNGKGIRKAVAEFKQLETKTQKLSFALGKMAGPAAIGVAAVAAAAVGVGTALFGAAKAADADRKSQKELAVTAERFAKANKAQVAGLEATIEQLMLATGIADDDLRPAMSRLVRSFKNTDKASRALKIALDISGRTGKDLTTVTEAMGKAADGNTGALARLGIGLSKAELKSMTLEQVMATLEERFKGGAAEAANTLEGRLGKLRARFGEVVETIGYKVLPYLETLADVAIKVFDAFAESGLTGGLQAFKAEMNSLQFQGSPMAKFFQSMYDATARVYNATQMLKDSVKLIAIANPSQWGRIGGDILQGRNPFGGMGNRMPTWDEFLATGPQVPGSAGQFRMRESGTGRANPNIVVNVNGGDPRRVVDAIRRYTYQNGPAPIAVR